MQGDRIQVLHMHFFGDTIYLYGQDHLDQLIEYKMRDQLQSNSALISMW